MSLLDKLKSKFSLGGSGYDAVQDKNRRAPATGILRSEDAELNPTDRRKLVSASRDLHRNYAIAAWMVRRHLDYVSTFNFRARSGNDALDSQIQRLMTWWMNPDNCDVTGRFSLPKLIRLAEMRRTVDQDVLLVKLNDGRIQAIEGDRLRTPAGGLPDGLKASDLVHGVLLDDFGKARQYCVCKRGKTSDIVGSPSTFTFERLVDASNAYLFGYFDRFDQVRGISPLAAALNTMRDTYESFDYALAKMKIGQMFGLSIFRDKSEQLAEVSTDESTGYDIDFGKGPVLLDLDPGDRAEFLESKSPSSEFRQFSEVMIQVALKSLDIPYSFYAENYTNYSGSRQALLQYELSAKIKQADVQSLLDHLTAWRISLWIQDGLIDADLRDIRWQWMPAGISWIDPLKEVNANIAAIGAGLQSRTSILLEQGIDFYELCDEIAAEQQYMTERGISPIAAPAQVTITESDNATPATAA